MKGRSKNAQKQSEPNRKNKEADRLARKIEVPKINTVTVQYNGNSKEFERFMESMIHEFLNSCSIANAEQDDSVGNVEKTEKSA